MWNKLEGMKTIATAAVALITGCLGVFGVIDESTALQLQTLLLPLALIFLRMGVKKVEVASE